MSYHSKNSENMPLPGILTFVILPWRVTLVTVARSTRKFVYLLIQPSYEAYEHQPSMNSTQRRMPLSTAELQKTAVGKPDFKRKSSLFCTIDQAILEQSGVRIVDF